jgi:hypothetical protein
VAATRNILTNLNLGCETMINKYVIFTLSFLALICASATAGNWKDNWRNSPLTTKNLNEWRKKP